MDNSRRFEGIWTFDREVTKEAGAILLEKVLAYRPELAEKIERAKSQYLHSETTTAEKAQKIDFASNNPDPFVQRLVTYLQAGQYKLIKANRFLVWSWMAWLPITAQACWNTRR